MQPTGEQIEELQQALLSAFNLDELRMMVHFRLNRILDQVVPIPNQTLTDIVYSTIRWAAAQEGGFLGLAENALVQSPDNPDLREFVTRYAGCTFDPLPALTARYGKGMDIPDPVPPMPPPRSQTFVGRHDELRELTRALKKDAFVALFGAPGMGKSELATRLAAQTADGFEKVFWYTFSSPADADDLVSELANFLAWYGRDDLWRRRHTSSNGGRQQVGQQFQLALSLLKQGGFLLYLEDLHNVPNDSLIQNFLEQLVARRFDLEIKLLATSRSKLDPKLQKRGVLLQGLDQQAVKQYLKKRLKKLTPSDEQVEVLHAATEGNPQFVVLAAAAIQAGADPEQLLARFVRPDEDIFAYLMNEVHERLTPEQILVMKAVAAHLGDPATPQAINATVGEKMNHIEILNSLLQRDLLNFSAAGSAGTAAERADQYTLTDVMRAFYYEELCTDEERTALHGRAAVYYIATGRHPWLSALHSERGQKYNEAALIAVEKLDQLILQSSWHKADALLARLLVQPLDGILPVRVRLAHARTTAAIDGWEAAVEDLLPAVAMAAGDPYYTAFVCYRLAQAHFKLKEIKAAGENFSAGIELLAAALTEPPAQRLLVRLHVGLAALRIQNQADAPGAKSSLDEAQRLLDDLQTAARDRTPRRSEGDLDDLKAQLASAWASYWQTFGNLEQAIVHADAAWQIVRHMIPREPRYAAAVNLATLLTMTQDPARLAQADGLLAEAEKTAAVLGHPEWRAKCQLTRGIAYHNAGELELAVAVYLDAYKIFVDLGDRDSLFDTCYNLAEAYAKLEQCEEARHYHHTAAALVNGPEAAELQHALTELAHEYPKCLVPED